MEKIAVRVTEAAEAIGVSRSKCYEMIATGEIPSIDIGGCKRVPVAELKAMIERRLAERG